MSYPLVPSERLAKRGSVQASRHVARLGTAFRHGLPSLLVTTGALIGAVWPARNTPFGDDQLITGAGRRQPQRSLVRLLLSTSALIAVTAQAHPALAQMPQDQRTIPSTTTVPVSLVNQGASYGNVISPPDQIGIPGGDANGWSVEVELGAKPIQTTASPLIAVHSIGGTGAQGGDTGTTGTGLPGGKGGDSGDIDFTIDPPGDDGSITSFEQGKPSSFAIDIRAIGGDGNIGQTPGGETEQGGPGGAGGIAGDINFTALQNDNAPSAYNYITATSGSTVVNLYSKGGAGGKGGVTVQSGAGTGTAGTPGMNGGNITANFSLNMAGSDLSDASGAGINATSQGGDGGEGGDGNSTWSQGKAGAGAVGGNGGVVSITQAGGSIKTSGSNLTQQVAVDTVSGTGTTTVSLHTVSAAIAGNSLGGNGGANGAAQGFEAKAGEGGQAGNGNTVSINLHGSGIYQTDGGYDPFRDQGAIWTSGDYAVGVVASSVGGAGGGSGQVGGAFSNKGGKGGLGGDGGQVYVGLLQLPTVDNDYVLITTDGNQSDGVIAQTIGGGGGVGGDVQGGSIGFSVQHGGSGGMGGNGDWAGIDNGALTANPDGSTTYQKPYVISTKGPSSHALLVQSIGGGGGRGGNAFGIAAGVGSLAVGGKGGTGGNAAGAGVSNYGVIQTQGSSSAGILAQAIGGGGGAGGSATSVDIGSILTTSFAIGGQGGAGGNGGQSEIVNFGQSFTLGSDSHALFAQSVGGGGGHGGASASQAWGLNPPDIPSMTVDVSVGGKGGAAGTGGEVDIYNGGLIMTQGANSFGVYAQSVGGGGGSGGDSSAMTQANVQSKLAVTTSVGGEAADGATGGDVTVANNGFITTLNYGGIGVFAQSVGGGGGNGGSGSSNQGAYNGAGDYSAELSMGLGGKGGAGGHGGDVKVYNYFNDAIRPAGHDPAVKNGNGNILTMGVSAAGIWAQSIGGGGGRGGDAMGKGGNGQVNLNIALGGNGGAGGDGGDVMVDAGEGTIVTIGADSAGIYGQSVGGGGGTGGNATTGSGNDPQYFYPEYFANNGLAALGLDPSGVEKITDNLWDWKDNLQGLKASAEALKQLADAYGSNNPNAPAVEGSGLKISQLTIDLGAGRAGGGGKGGVGGTVDLGNFGEIATFGSGSPGMLGKSVGGGGGKGGASTATAANDKLQSSLLQGAINLGAQGGAGGAGGEVSLRNGTDQLPNNAATIATARDLSHGMHAISVGGGGGIAGFSGANGILTGGFHISAGADGGTSGAGGDVSLDSHGGILTAGDDAIGMFGQSIGGGGGYVTLGGQDFDPDTGIAYSTSQSFRPTSGNVTVSIVDPNAGSEGGDVNALLRDTGSITTSGINSYGILAQSVGGGGGVFIVDPGNGNNASCDLYPAACDNGKVHQNDGGEVTVITEAGSQITTAGNGAAGIFAQSIGGGGAIINGLAHVDLLARDPWGVPERGDQDLGGNAGFAGSIDVESSGDITTTGDYAHGIFAQAASNGGGVVGRDDGTGYLFSGYMNGVKAPSCVGFPCNGHVKVNLNAGTVRVSGAHAVGVGAVSVGGAGSMNEVDIVVAPSASVIAAGEAAGAILMEGGGINNLTNLGTIDASGSSAGIAVNSAGLNAAIANGGSIAGSILTPKHSASAEEASVMFRNRRAGVFEAGQVVDLGVGQLTNNGTLRIGAAGDVATTRMTGDLVQGAGGTLHVDVDLAADKADQIAVEGTAKLAGAVHVTPVSVSNRSIDVMSVTDGLTLDPQLVQTDDSALFDFPVMAAGDRLTLAPQANFEEVSEAFGDNRRAIAGHLQKLWDDKVAFDDGFTALAWVDQVGVAAALDQVSGQHVGLIGAEAYRSSLRNTASLWEGCDPSVGGQYRCGWGTLSNQGADQDGNSDRLGYGSHGNDLQIGGAIALSEATTVGGAFSYGNFSAMLDGGAGSVSGDTARIAGFVTWQSGNWRLSGAADYGHGWYDSSRRIAVGGLDDRIAGSTTGWQAGLHGRAAWNKETAWGWIEPRLDVSVIHNRIDGFTERGDSPFSLDVDGSSDTLLAVTPAIEAARSFSLANGSILRAHGSVGYQMLSDDTWTNSAQLDDRVASFETGTAVPDRLLQLRLGLDLVQGETFNVSAEFQRDIGSDYQSNQGALRMEYRF